MKKLFLISVLCIASTAISLAQLKVISGGNVGIGTTSPRSKLEVFDNISKILISTGKYTESMSDNEEIGGIEFYKHYGIANSAAIRMRQAGDGNHYGQAHLAFYTSNDVNPYTATPVERMRITSDGDVCIGATSSPHHSKEYIYTNNGYAGLRVFNEYEYAAYNLVSMVNGPNVKSIVSQYSGDRFTVFGDGSVNIECNFHDPAYKLIVWGSAFANGLWQGSDLSFKQNITDIVSPMDKLNQLSGNKYEYNTTAFPDRNFPTGYTYGVIAQEVQAVLPELVQADSAGYLAVNYDGLIPVIIEAIKEQNITIDSLTYILKSQEEHINTIETDLANCCQVISPVDNKSLQLPNGTNNNPDGASGSPALYQNVPNPFKEKTTIRYYLPNESVAASMLIFDMQGKLIKTYNINTTGNGNIEINAGILQPGMYMYSLIANGKEVDTKKMILTE